MRRSFARISDGPARVAGQVSAFQGLREYFAPSVITQLARVGVQLVRMPVNPAPLLENNAQVRDNLIDELVRAASELNAAGIAVVFDLHFWSPANKTWTEETILDGPSGAGFAAFRNVIMQLAKKLGDLPHGAAEWQLRDFADDPHRRPCDPVRGRKHLIRLTTGGVGLRPQPPATVCYPFGIHVVTHNHTFKKCDR